ncbi:MAG: glycosyltransferase family 2 protein [bacterium]|nr:glycosyltransferase family 2 protein [bacterium]
MPIKISCIIPTSDRESTLDKAIASVLSQTRLPDEVLVVDNGNLPARISEEFASQVKIYRLAAKSGAARARNFGATQAKGDCLAFLDDDDLWNKNYLSNVEKAVMNGAECVLGGIQIIKDGVMISSKNPAGKLVLPILLISNPGVVGSNLAISKNLFMQVGGFDPKLATSEDKSLIIEILRAGSEVKVLSDNLVFVSRQFGTAHLSDDATMAKGIYSFTRKYIKLMSFRQWLHNWYKIYYYRHKAGIKTATLPYTVFYLLHKFFSI